MGFRLNPTCTFGNLQNLNARTKHIFKQLKYFKTIPNHTPHHTTHHKNCTSHTSRQTGKHRTHYTQDITNHTIHTTHHTQSIAYTAYHKPLVHCMKHNTEHTDYTQCTHKTLLKPYSKHFTLLRHCTPHSTYFFTCLSHA